jgi:alkylation response protein AidB-like acyl-CoA dehydrogenase
MSTIPQTYEASLERVCRDTIRPNAAMVDGDGVFPEHSIDALKSAGFLGVMSSPEVGGLGLGIPGATAVVRRVAEACGSTAMVLCMHYCGTAVLEAHAPADVRGAAATGSHLSTLAFSEVGSRSHFWAPDSTAEVKDGRVALNARKSWATSASHATAYVWSSKPLSAEGLSTLWLVPANAPGLAVEGPFVGLGLRGNDSSPIVAQDVLVAASAMLGADGKGFDIMMSIVLPLFNILNAACSVGLMNAATASTIAHAGGTRHTDTASALADLPTIRNYIARMRIKTDMVNALLDDTVAAVQANRADTMLRVLECKAAAGETANEVLDLAMRVCGGAAYRKDVGVERYFRDARAAGVMSPTTDMLYDFIGKAVCGMPVF